MEGKQSLPKGRTSKEPTTNVHSSKEMHEVMAEEDATCCKTEHYPSFSSTLKPYNIKKSVLSIPLDFARTNGLRKKCCEAILRDEKHRSWPVNIRHEKTHVYLGKGWSNFCITNGLKEGDEFVIELIKHAKKPIIFNFRFLTQNKKLVKTHVRVGNHQPPRDSCDPRYRAEKRKRSKREDHDLDNLEAQTKEQELKSSSRTYAKDHFTGILKRYSIERSHLNIPLQFARSNGLSKKFREVTFKDEKQRSWPIILQHDETHVRLGKGWNNLCITNGLKEGDEFMIELMKHGDKPIMNFRLINQNNKLVKTRVRANQSLRDSCDPRNRAEKRKRWKRDHDLDLEAQTKEQELKSSPGTSAKDHFVGILKRYSIEQSHLYFPLEFARSNGLTNGEMILENENGKLWLVELRLRHTGFVYISRGWKQFRIANNLKEGDGFKLELLENTGKLPIAKFSCL